MEYILKLETVAVIVPPIWLALINIVHLQSKIYNLLLGQIYMIYSIFPYFSFILQQMTWAMSIANGQTVLKIGETVLTRLPLHHPSTSIKHRRIHYHFHRFLSNLQYFPRLRRRRVVVEWNHQTPILVQSSHQHTVNHCHDILVVQYGLFSKFLPDS